MQRGGIHGNPGSGNHPKKGPPTGTVTLKDISGSSLPDQIHTRNQHTKRRGREESGKGSKNLQRFPSMSSANDLERTAHVVQ